MPNQSPRVPRVLLSRAKRGFCFCLLLHTIIAFATQAQVQRPKILGIGGVRIEGTATPSANPIHFYSQLGWGSMGSFQAGATAMVMHAVNDHQELDLVSDPRPEPRPQDPLPNHVSEVLFETSDVVGIHEYLISKKVSVDDIKPSPTGEARVFTFRDPDSHWIGFIQYGSPLKSHREEEQVSARLIHVGFIVRDRAAMEHFYKDILGFRPYWHGGRTEDRDDWVSLQVPDGGDWVEFMLNVPDNADRRALGVANHIALGVTDIQAAKAQLIKNGVTLTEEPKIGRGGKWQMNLYDPDGTRIEFMEFTPVQKPCCSEYTAPHPKP